MNLTLTMKSKIVFFPSNFGSCYISVITYFSENRLAPCKQSIRKELICVKPQTREKYWGAIFIRYVRQSSGKVGKSIKKLSSPCRCSCGAAQGITRLNYGHITSLTNTAERFVLPSFWKFVKITCFI